MIKQLFEEERDVGNPALQDGIPRESDSMKQKGGEAGFSPLQEKGQKTAQTQRRTLVRRPVLSKSHQNILERAKDADRIMTVRIIWNICLICVSFIGFTLLRDSCQCDKRRNGKKQRQRAQPKLDVWRTENAGNDSWLGNLG